MIQVFLYFYAAVLCVGVLGGWVLRRAEGHQTASTRLVRWTLLGFPLLLFAVMTLKPIGPSFWVHAVKAGSLAGKMVGLALLIVVMARGIAELVLVRVDWQRKLLQAVPLKGVEQAAWYHEACSVLGVAKRPSVRAHHALKTPLVVGPWKPKILLPANLVPAELRDDDPIWEAAGEAKGDLGDLQVKVHHELKHVAEGDALKLWVMALGGVVVPWEWIVEDPGLEKLSLTRQVPFKWLSGMFRWIGTPYRRAFRAERSLQESGADRGVLQVNPGAEERLEKLRGGKGRIREAGAGLLQDWKEMSFGVLSLVLLSVAPGRGIIGYAWGGKMVTLMPLPPTWSFVIEAGFGQGSAGLLPAEGREPGRILVDLKEVVPGKLPLLKGVGRLRPGDLPPEGTLELTWEVESQDQALKGMAAQLQLTKIPIVDDADPAAMGILADNAGPAEDLGQGRVRYRRRIDLGHMTMEPTWIYIDFYFQGEGRYIVYPPRVEIVTGTGERRPLQGG